MKKLLQQQLIRRLRIMAGQVKGLENMVAQEKYCIDIIHQSLAIQQALGSLNEAMLKNHLSTHVVHQIKVGQEKKAIEEILSICRLSKK